MRRNHKSNSNRSVQAVQYKKDLGQHFLYDMEFLRSLVREIGVTDADSVLEIGAGAGTLTRALCETGAKVNTVEVDQALIPNLRLLEMKFRNLTVVQGDIRKVNLGELSLGSVYKVAANIPYSITTQIFDLFWGKEEKAESMSVMVQKEVADKLTATPGDKVFGLLSVRCRYYCEPVLIAQVPASAFTPPPKVDSAFVKLAFRKEPPIPVKDTDLLWRLVNASYRMRRKTLANAMKSVLPIEHDAFKDILKAMNLPQTVRGETLSVEQWITLSNEVATRNHPCSPSRNY